MSVDEGNVAWEPCGHTRVRTGRGDVSIKHVEGNVDVLAGGGGSVSLSKILAQDVKVAASGMLKCTALYSKVLDVTAEDGLLSSVLSSEAGTLRLGGTSSLDSAEGELRIALAAECEGLTVQAIEGLRKLRVHDGSFGGAEPIAIAAVHRGSSTEISVPQPRSKLRLFTSMIASRWRVALRRRDRGSSSSSSSAEMSIELVQIGLAENGFARRAPSRAAAAM